MNEKRFLFMHQDDAVCMVSIDLVSGVVLRVSRPHNPELLPLGGSADADAFRRWWQRRAMPMSRDRIQALLSDLGLASTHEYLVRNIGLSLSDHYWIKPIDADICWNDINLFTNAFNCEVAETGIKKNTVQMGGAAAYSPEASTQGNLSKKWIIADGCIRLIKGNRGNNSQNSLNEVVATLLHKKQGLHQYCAYSVFRHENNGRIHCICDCFTSANIEFIPAIDLIESKKKSNSVSNYEHLINVCVANGIPEERMRSFMEYQILTDFVITNTDRHLNNFGVLRDAKTLRFIGPAPIFDSGNSMFWDDPTYPSARSLSDIPVNGLYKTETRLLQLVRDRSNIDVSKLPSVEELCSVYANDPLITHLDSILLGYQKKIDML